MGLIVDSGVIIDAERRGQSPAGLFQSFPDQMVIAAVTVSELVEGMYRADPRNRPRRESFIDRVLAQVPVVPFDLRVAWVYGRLLAEARGRGQPIGVHDLQIAATALAFDHGVLTGNASDFERVPGLVVRRA